MREKITCPFDEIPVVGQGVLKISKSFKMCCVGLMCEKYPCDEVKKICGD